MVFAVVPLQRIVGCPGKRRITVISGLRLAGVLQTGMRRGLSKKLPLSIFPSGVRRVVLGLSQRRGFGIRCITSVVVSTVTTTVNGSCRVGVEGR